MKLRLGLAIFVFIGLTLVEWGCNDDNEVKTSGRCGDRVHRIKTEDTISLYRMDDSNYELVKDSVSDLLDLYYRCHFNIESVQTGARFGTTLYALSISECEYYLVEELDSVHVFLHDRDIEITEAFGINVGTPPELDGSNDHVEYYRDWQDVRWLNEQGGVEIRYKAGQPDKIDLSMQHKPDGLEKGETYRIRFEFYFDDGSQYRFISRTLLFQ